VVGEPAWTNNNRLVGLTRLPVKATPVEATAAGAC
jgi:hypothetical protein